MTAAVDGQESIIIRNEDDAFRYLQSALEQKLGEAPLHIVFENWPIVSIKLDGEGYDSTITSRLAEALVDLQHAMNRTYARAAHGSANPNTLTNDEKRDIQFKAKVEKGSSLISVDLGSYAEKLATALAGKMDGTDIAITVIGTALVGGGILAYKAFLKSRSEDKKVDAGTQERIALSQEETRRMTLMTQAMTAQPRLAVAQQDFDDVRHGIVKSVSDASTLSVQGVSLSASEARAIAATPRSKAEEVQLNGHYMIHKIDWSKQDDARISLYSTDESVEFSANLDTGSLKPENKEMLKASEWDRKRLHMTINATRLRGEITTARIVGVEWPKDTPSAV
jgi:dihydroxyacetone kinase DhaKLM complex PTS-EIIA-like component DhaM